jgi:hypothetical protein
MSTTLLPTSNPRKSPLLRDSRCQPQKPHRKRQLVATGLSKTRAEAVLDWLEAHGHSDCQVAYVADEGFAIIA